MPPRTRRLRHASHAVTAVLVSHDGECWLAETLAALTAQTRPPQRVVAVDTASTDNSRQVLAAALGESSVVSAPRDTALGTAIQVGLDAFVGAPSAPRAEAVEHEWIWILHDDSAPAPDALEQLLERVDSAPSIAVVGPKVLTWDRHYLREVGITVDSSGIRRTGLEPREVDQGQHDNVDDVLAVGTAGMLVRRDVWDRLGGLDPAFALFGDDSDFGWRVNATGGRVAVAPQAVLRHASAVSDGLRAADAVTGPAGATARVHGMRVVLANTSSWLVLPLALRYVVECLVRAVFLLLLGRSPRRARNEVLALVQLIIRPGVIVSARRARSSQRTRRHGELRHLLAPPGWRWRAVADGVAATFAGREAVEERQRRRAPVETGPVAAEAESFAVDDLGVLARLLTRPGVVVVLALLAFALVANRGLYGGALHGGRLAPPPGGASDLWSTYLSGWHGVGLGGTATAPAWLAVLAAFATICAGKVWLAVDVLVLGAVPLAGMTAYLASRRVIRRPIVRAWASAAYALAPAVTGAVAGGRLDVIVVVILTPLLLRAVAGALRPAATVRFNRAVAAGLLLAVVAAFMPVVWVVVAVATVAGLAVLRGPNLPARATAAAALLVVAPVVLLPWTWHVATHPTLLVSGVGLPEQFASRSGPSGVDLLLAHPGGPAQPALWVWVPVVLASLVGVTSRRAAAYVGFTVFAAGAATAIVVSRLAAGPATNGRYWTGAILAVAGAGAVLAAAAAVDEAPETLRRHVFSWRQPVAVVVGVAGVVALLQTGIGWLVRGSDQPIVSSQASVLPVFSQAEAAAPTTPRALVVRGTGTLVRYALLRGAAGLELGDADVAPAATATSPGRRALAAAVADAAAGRDQALGELAEFGVTQVVVPATGTTTGGLASVTGLARVPATTTVVYRSTMPTGELVVLSAADAAGVTTGGALASTAKPLPLNASSGHAHVQVPSSADPNRLLVLAEARSSAWRATLDGHRLTPVRAYGWAQAWRLPPVGGELTVSRSDNGRTGWLVLELLAVIVAVSLALPTRRAST